MLDLVVLVVVVVVPLLVVVVVLVPVPVPPLAGLVQEAWTFLTGPVPGGTRLEAGVPGGALTWKVSVCPVTSVTVTVHSSADAAGMAAMPRATKAEPAEMARTFSFRRIDDTGGPFLPRGWLRSRAATVDPAR